jgi:hypothetical protein
MPGTGNFGGAIWAPITGAASPAFDTSYPFRGVIHTTETTEYTYSSASYYGHLDPPHFTVVKKPSGVQIFQHFSTNNGARSLKNEDGGIQTNAGGAIQIEIAWRSANITSLPASMKTALRELISWISMTKGIDRTSPPFFDEAHGYGSGAPSRMSFESWRGFNAWCGHQHVPENVHWDPGPIDIAALLS